MRNLTEMMGLDIYLASLGEEELQQTQQHIQPKKKYRPPLICWDVYVNHYHQILTSIEKNAEVDALNSLAHDYDLDFNFEFIHDKQYDALVFTSIDQTILWVSSGFASMTGYTRNFAMGKKPHFLQGPNTSTETKKRIKNQLRLRKPVRETIVNYRKDQSEYFCEIEIFPVQCTQGDLKGFFAVERKV